MDYSVFILSGGEGKRLLPLTLKTPKPAIPLANKPFLFYQMDLIEELGVEKCYILSGKRAKSLKKIFNGKYKSLKIEIIEEDEPMGTGGAIGFAKEKINGGAIVLNGDVLFELDLKKIIEEHKERKADGTIMAIEVEDPSRYGVILTDEKDQIMDFLEKVQKPPSNLINAGLYILEWNVLKEIPSVPCSIERDIFPDLIKKGFKLYCHKYYGYWKDIGTIESYKECSLDLISGKISRWEKESKENRILSKREDFEIDDYSILGKDCKIGSGTKIYKSIIFDNCKIGKNCIIEDSIISYSINLKENSKIMGEVLIGN